MCEHECIMYNIYVYNGRSVVCKHALPLHIWRAQEDIDAMIYRSPIVFKAESPSYLGSSIIQSRPQDL